MATRPLAWTPLAIVGLAWLASLVLWLSPGITAPDGFGYFQYLPSAVLDGDLAFYDEWERAGLVEPGGRILHEQPTRIGMLGDHWPAGTATWWLPAFLAGDAASRLGGTDRAGGFDMAHLLPAILASAVAGLLALAISWRIAASVTTDAVAALACLGAWFGSPLLFYSIRNSLTSHAVGAMACALCVACALRLRERIDAERVLAFGLAAGFAFAVRPQNAPFALLPLFVLDLRGADVRRALLRALPWIGLGGLLGALPQLVASTFLYGSPFGSLRLGGGEGAAFAPFERVWTWEPLLSWYHGMLPWTPVLGLAVAGFIFLWRKDRGLGMAAVFSFATQWAINASLERSFWGGYAFGQRRFDNCTVFFVLGLAALLARVPRWAGVVVVAACSLWTTALVLAAPRFDLNAYQPPGVLARAAADAVGDVATWARPLASVPPGFRWVVLGWIAGTLAVFALAAWAVGRLPPRAITGLAVAWLAGTSALFAVAGARSGGEVARRQDMISFNRSLGIRSGAVDFRLGLLHQELAWLEATGRQNDAARTRTEIDDIERRRSAP